MDRWKVSEDMYRGNIWGALHDRGVQSVAQSCKRRDLPYTLVFLFCILITKGQQRLRKGQDFGLHPSLHTV